MATLNLTCARSLTVRPGAHAQRTYRAISGATRTRVFGSQPVGSALSAEFQVATDKAAATLKLYHETRSGALPVDLPDGFWTGHEDLGTFFEALNLTWHFAEQPSVEPFQKGLVRLRLELEGRLEA